MVDLLVLQVENKIEETNNPEGKIILLISCSFIFKMENKEELEAMLFIFPRCYKLCKALASLFV